MDCEGDPKFFVGMVRNLIEKKNRNCVIAVLGAPGTGKSYLSLWLASQLDSSFPEHMEERICFTGKSFLELLKEGNLQKGNALVLDEAGVSAFNRNFYDFINKAIVFTLQTFRHRNLYLILTVPSLSFVDAHVRRLINYVAETKKVSFKEKMVTTKVFRVEHNPRLGKVYSKYFRMPWKPFETKRLTWFKFPRAEKGLCNRYEKVAEDYKLSLTEQLNKEFTEQEEASKTISVPDIAEQILGNLPRYIKQYAGKEILDKSQIEMDFGVGCRLSKRIQDYTLSIMEGKNPPKSVDMSISTPKQALSPAGRSSNLVMRGESESNPLSFHKRNYETKTMKKVVKDGES